MLNIGNLVPASYMKFGGEEYPDLFKFYTVVPTRSTESTAANQRRPVLYTSLNGGVRWCFESQTSSSTTHGLYDANYSGNFYFKASDGSMTAFAHKSSSSSYGAYKARCGGASYRLGLANQSWEWSSVVAYNTANQPDREICKEPDSNRFFCVKNGGGYVYNDTAWGTANWTTTAFGTSSLTTGDDGGFKHICVDREKPRDALIFFTTNDSNKYLRFYLCNLNDLSSPVNYTTTLFGATTRKQSEFRYVSIDYLPGVGYLIIYDYVSNNDFCVKILRTYDPVTGERLPYNQYIMPDALVHVGTSDSKIVQYGNHGWYCPWTKEYYFCPNARQMWSTKDGLNWTQVGVNTGAAATTRCQKLITDGQSIVIATSGSAFYYSRDKGQTWTNDYTLSPNGFNTNRSTDAIVLPFKCTNNLGINKQTLVVGESIGLDGSTTANTKFFRTDYIPIDPNVLYVFYGSCTNPYGTIAKRQKSWYNRILFYDSDHNFISGKEGADYTTTGSPTREVPCIALSPSTAAYAILCTAMSSAEVTTEIINSYKWYFAKEEDFEVMTKYGDIVVN